MKSLFDDYPRFFETSTVSAWPIRLALRHHAIIEANHAIFANARVLDLASHDGRWSFAALKAGAVHVTGIEARQHMVDAARDTMRAYGVPEAAYDFTIGDLNHQTRAPESCDVVLCLGYFYHTLNHLALLEYLASTSAGHIVLDGTVEPGEENVIRVYAESIADDANGTTATGVLDGRMLVGHPTVNVLAQMLRHFGYESAVFDWPGLLAARAVYADVTRPNAADNPVSDYAQGKRATILATRVRAEPGTPADARRA